MTDVMEYLSQARRILCDLDGCLIQNGRAIEGAAAFVEQCGERFRILSNNSTDSPESLAQKLMSYGISIAPNQIILAGTTAIDEIAIKAPGNKLMILGCTTITDYAQTLGLTLVDVEDHTTRPDLILVCRDLDLSYHRIQKVIHLITDGVPYWSANPDLTHPGPAGLPMIETGSIVKFIEAATNIMPVQTIGKPETRLYLQALDDISPEQAIMIGDNPLTDIEGANRLNMPSILVGQTRTVAQLQPF